ncbi:MAG: M48 family metallopeptidase [Planctomycetota bacterium]
MTPPIAFLLGLLTVAAHCELDHSLPGASTLDGVLMWSLTLVVPWLLVTLAQNAIVLRLVQGQRSKRLLPLPPPRSLKWLSMAALPLSLHALFAFGHYGEAVERLFPNSHTLRYLAYLAPLYVGELPRLWVATMVDALLEAGVPPTDYRISPQLLPRRADVWPSFRLRLGWPLLMLLPLVLLGLSLDVLALNRELYATVLATMAGRTCGMVLFVFATAAVLPFWFRFAFGLHRTIPEPSGGVLRRAVGEFGFSQRRLFVLPTGRRAINAMMVGPLPIGRLLCLTDGLLATLDVRSLTGVLAHEVGHARMGHPGILLMLAVLMPLMLFAPLQLLDADQLNVLAQAAILVGFVVALWLAVRTLARRFEFEADVASVRALGAGPCSDALRTVSQIALPPPKTLRSKAFSVHPDESKRLEVMERYENDAGFRQRFDRGTRRVRVGIALALLAATGVGAYFWRVDWAFERIAVAFYAGHYDEVRGSIDELGPIAELPIRWRRIMADLDEESRCALELAPTASSSVAWAETAAALRAGAWQRGVATLLDRGPAAARAWMSLAITAEDDPGTTRLAVYEWCHAASVDDADRVLALGEIIRRRGVPLELQPAFR